MKTPEEWFDQENLAEYVDEVEVKKFTLDLICRIQQDAQPKWVTGEEAKKFDNHVILLQQGKDFIITVKCSYLHSPLCADFSGDRFLRLDDILNQQWPK